MEGLDREKTGADDTVGLQFRKKDMFSSNSMKRTSDWIFSQEVQSDLTVQVGGTSFSLHRFPLVSKSGYVRKLISESTDDDDLVSIDIPDVPGGAPAFELAMKFCYGVNFEISIENIALLRCVAEHLEMTEEYAVGNLVGRTEAYLAEVAFKSLSGAISVLHSSENLLPVAEEVKLVSRCIDAIAYLVCKDNQFAMPIEGVHTPHHKPIVDWWAEDLTLLRIDLFQRVLVAMMARGLKQYALGPILMLYAQKSLRGLEVYGKVRKKIEPKEEHEKRVILETVVSLLPREMNALSVSFLSMLLRSSIYLETTVACRLDLEKRMALQLGQAVLDDLLIPSYSFSGDTLFDVDTVKRIMTSFLQLEMDRNNGGFNMANDYVSPLGDFERVGKLMENYLAEIASDRNLSVVKFIGLAELIPEQSRVTEDGMYRAIDIFFKAHPSLTDMDRKKICSLMDCQKLSREACAHAAQNDRLPVQTVVQVLYYEQQRLREAMSGNPSGAESPVIMSRRANIFSTETNPPASAEFAKLKRENEDLKLELVKTKMKLKEIERSATNSPARGPTGSSMYSADKPPLPRKSFISSVSKTLGRLYTFAAPHPNPKGRTKPPKDRRHSIS